MSRFIAPNLADLGDVPQTVPIDFEEIKQSRDDYLEAALKASGIDYDVTNLETDPLVIAYSEGGGYQEMKFRQRVNEAIRGLSLATAAGGDLDHIGATYAGGISRLEYSNAKDKPPLDAIWNEDKQKWVESDGSFRARIMLAYEAFSTAGPEGAYIFHALELDGVRDIADAAVYSEEDGATYSVGLFADAYSANWRDTPFKNREENASVLAPEALIVIMPTLEYGEVNQALLDRAFQAVTSKDVRPIGDNVRIEPAKKISYDIEVVLSYAPGADVETLREAALYRLAEYAKARRRIGLAIQREVIGGRAAIDNGVTVEVVSPSNDILPGSKGYGEVSNIVVRTLQTRGSWRDD